MTATIKQIANANKIYSTPSKKAGIAFTGKTTGKKKAIPKKPVNKGFNSKKYEATKKKVFGMK